MNKENDKTDFSNNTETKKQLDNQDLKQKINYKIANDDNFRLELCLDYLEYYENELKKYQK